MINKKTRKSWAFPVAILFIGLCIIPITSGVAINKNIDILGNDFGNILYVGGSGGGNYSTIQEAIDDAIAGDTVYVFDDSSPYQENIRINKQIFVIGENRDTTIISGISGQDHAVRISSKNAEINGFTIIGDTGGDQDGIAVFPLMEEIIISNNIVKDCSYGIFLQATSTRVTISNNIITNNEFEGIILQESDRNVISGNTITENGGFGISLETISNQNEILDNTMENNFAGLQLTGGSSQNTISGNQILNNEREGIKIDGVITSTNEIIGNNITGNNAGMKVSGGKNIINGNSFKDNNLEGLYLTGSNENIIEMNNFIGNRRNARFILSFRNSWDSNYWDNWIGIKFDFPLFKMFPKAIRGFTLINFDMNPQEVPYAI
jgi:parallel beta-helix repeat protein